MTDWTIILRSMTARLFSTVTTIITVAVAVGLMLVLLMMRDSGRKAFERGSGNMHLLVSADASPLVSILNGIYYANPPRRPVTWAKYNEIARNFPLEYAIPTQIGDSYEGRPVLATTPDFFSKFEPVAGEPWMFRQGRGLENQWDVVLGSRTASETGLKLGDQIVLTHGSGGSREGGGGGHVHAQFKFTVVGMLGPTGSAHDRALFTNIEASWIMHAFDRRER
jgi:putative ABC transport system permease protein